MMWKASTGWLAIVFLVHSVCAQKAVLKTGEQLPVGGTVGTYRLSYDLKVEFPGEAERVHCSVYAPDMRTVAEKDFDQKGELSLSFDLHPGTYLIWLEPRPDGPRKSRYVGESLIRFHIDREGVFHAVDEPFVSSVLFRLLITGVRPSGREVVNGTTPLIRWDAVAGAAYYEVRFYDWPGREWRSAKPEVLVSLPLRTGRVYEFAVKAFRADEKEIATGGGEFRTPGAPEAELPVLPGPASQPEVAANQGVLGVALRDVWGASRRVRGGVVVEGVMPGSAAMEAGLLPDDVIVKINGNGFANADEPIKPGVTTDRTSKFIEQIRGFPPGTKIRLTVVRSSLPDMEVEVTLGAKHVAR